MEVQSLEERVEKIESVVQAGNTNLQHAGEAVTQRVASVKGLTVEVQSLEERVEQLESAVQAGILSLQHAEAAPANMSVAYKYKSVFMTSG